MRSRVVAALLFVVIAVAAGGCTSDDDPDAGPSPEATDTTSTGTSTGTSTATSDATSDLPAVEPASGEEAELGDSLSLRVPAEGDWYIDDGGGSIFAAATVDGVTVDIGGSDVLSDIDVLDEGASLALDVLDDQPGMTYRRGDDITVSGKDCWVIDGRSGDKLFKEVGTLHKGRIVHFDFTFRAPEEPSFAKELMASVMASVEWK